MVQHLHRHLLLDQHTNVDKTGKGEHVSYSAACLLLTKTWSRGKPPSLHLRGHGGFSYFLGKLTLIQLMLSPPSDHRPSAGRTAPGAPAGNGTHLRRRLLALPPRRQRGPPRRDRPPQPPGQAQRLHPLATAAPRRVISPRRKDVTAAAPSARRGERARAGARPPP